MREQGALTGIFFIPGQDLNMPAGYANAYRALVELDYFARGYGFHEIWPGNIECRENIPPYGVVYLVSTDYGQPAFGSMQLGGAIKTVALKLFCDLVGLGNLRSSVLADGLNQAFGFYGSFGVAAALYPKYSLMEVVACLVAQQLVQRWLAPQTYRTATGDQVAINPGAVYEEVDSFLSQYLEKGFDALDSGGAGPSVSARLADDVDRICQGLVPSPERLLGDKFRSGMIGNYYADVQANIPLARDAIIKGIRELIVQKTEETQSLGYAEELLNQTGQWIRNTQQYWERRGVAGDIHQWNAYVAETTRTLLEGLGRWLGMKREVLASKARGLLDQMKVFFLRRILEEVARSLEEGKLSTTDSSVMLPTRAQLQKARAGLQRVQEFFDNRLREAEAEVNDTSVPLLRVWRTGKYESDRDDLLERYKGQHGLPSFKDVAHENAWDFLTRAEPREVFLKAKVAYEGRCAALLGAFNVTSEAQRAAGAVANYARRALSGFVRLDPPGRAGEPGIPRFVLAADQAQAQALVAELQNHGITEFRQGHVQPLPLLDHMVVFYEEKAGITPLQMLVIREPMKAAYDNPPVGPTGVSEVSSLVWQQQRSAYNLDVQGRLGLCRTLADFVLDFGVAWRYSPERQRWEPQAARWEAIRISPAGRPQFTFRDSQGAVQTWEVSTDLPNLRQLVLRGLLEPVKAAIAEVVRSKGSDKFNYLFQDEVKPYLVLRYGESEARRREQLYLGSQNQRGLVSELAEVAGSQ